MAWKLDRFSQLVEDLTTGKLTLTQVQIAIRASIRDRKDVPDEVKDLLCGGGSGLGGHSAGIIYRMFNNIQEVIGTVELAYRRGTDKDEE